MTILVNRPLLNLFAGPDFASDQVSQLLLGAQARVLEEWEDWVYVRGSDDYCGWAYAEGFEPEGPDLSGERARVATLYANLRHRPSTRSGPLLCVPFGVVLPVDGREPGWVGLRLPDGRVGWLEEGRIEPPLPYPADADSVLRLARRFLGVPYLWGGVSSFGIDCSGLTQLVFGLHGMPLPRDANQQAALGEPVAREAVRAGDLLYFAALPDAERDRITHVAIASDSGNMVHALGGQAVVETPIAAVTAFWGGRRILREWGSEGASIL